MAKGFSKTTSTSKTLGTSVPKLGASSSSKPPSPLMPKKDYRKKSAQKNSGMDFGTTSFGETGLTGES